MAGRNARRGARVVGPVRLAVGSAIAVGAPLTAASLRNENILAGGMSITTLARTRPKLLRQITAEALALVAGGAVTVDVRHALPLSGAAHAHRLLESRESTGKLVLGLQDDAGNRSVPGHRAA